MKGDGGMKSSNNFRRDKMKSLKKYSREDLEKELHRRDSLSPEQRLAEILHTLLCRKNRINECDWFSDSWNRMGGLERKEYLEKAERALEIVSEDTIVAILSAVR